MTPLEKADRVRPGSSFLGGRVRYMAHADGYVMARRPGCIPFVVAQREWLSLPFHERGGQ